MKRIAMFMFAALICALASTGIAAAQSKASAASIDELMHKSGISVQMDQVESIIQASLVEQQTDNASVQKFDLKTLREAVAKAYAGDVVREEVRRQLAATLSQTDVNEVLTWLSSDLGQRLTKLEEQHMVAAALLMQDEEKMTALIDGLSARRKATLGKFVKAIRAGETGVEMTINTTLGLTYGMALAAPHGIIPDFVRIKEELESQKPELVAAYEQYGVVQFALIYQSVSDSDLDKYLAFAESAVGKRYHDATIQAMDVALTRAARELGRQIGKPLKAARYTQPNPARNAVAPDFARS